MSQITQNRRTSKRRPVKRGIHISARRGALGLGPNLAIGAITVAEDGISLCVACEFTKGDEIEIEMTPPGAQKPIRVRGDVRWCRHGAGNRYFTIGIRFGRRLRYAEFSSLGAA